MRLYCVELLKLGCFDAVESRCASMIILFQHHFGFALMCFGFAKCNKKKKRNEMNYTMLYLLSLQLHFIGLLSIGPFVAWLSASLIYIVASHRNPVLHS